MSKQAKTACPHFIRRWKTESECGAKCKAYHNGQFPIVMAAPLRYSPGSLKLLTEEHLEHREDFIRDNCAGNYEQCSYFKENRQ